jgi:hypothetical protein
MLTVRRAVAGVVIGSACVLTALTSGFQPSPAYADDEDPATGEARKFYGEAKKAMSEKRYKDAALGFEASAKIKAHAVAFYTAAQAWELAGDPARAADDYTRALATPKLNENQSQRSQDRLAELAKQLGIVSVDGDEGTKVKLDDHMESGVPVKLYGTPGDHELSVSHSDGSSEKRKVTIEQGKTVQIDADDRPEPQPGTPTVKKKKTVQLAEPQKHPVEPEPAKPSSALKTVGFIGIGAGVAALGGGVLLGLSAKDAEKTYKATPSQETYDHAKQLQTRTNIMLIAGGVLTAGGLGLVIWQSTKSEKAVSIRVAPRSLMADGHF